MITNTADGISPREFNRIQEAEGTLECALYRRAIYGHKPHTDLHAPAYSPLYHGRKAEFYFENLECTLHAGNAFAQEQVTRFARAVKQLAQRT